MPEKKLILGLVVDRSFHEQNKWVSATTYHLVEAFKVHFDCVYIQNQSDYEEKLGLVDLLISMEPGWAAPVLEFSKTEILKSQLSRIPSFIFFSDPHANKWREDYFLKSNIDYILSFYCCPILYHFQKVPQKQIIHFPWAVPDCWISNNSIVYGGQKKICCFGGSKSNAYELRNWCRTFDFVESSVNSGVENKIMSEAQYIEWLRQKDAAIAAGSDSQIYKLTVPKYFEIPAAGPLLFAQQTDDLGILGFKHMQNCIMFNRANFEELARAYLANPQAYIEIRKAGRNLIKSNHSLSQRMNSFLKLVDNMIESKKHSKQNSIALLDSKLNPQNHIIASKEDKSLSDNRAKILFIPDKPGWAHEFKTDNLIRTLGGSFQIQKRFMDEVTADDIEQSDLIVIYYWKQFLNTNMQSLLKILEQNKRKLLLGICSHHELNEKYRTMGVEVLRKFAAGIFVNNLLLYKEFLPLFEVPIFYTPNGVDTQFFKPAAGKNESDILRVGWAGSLTNQGTHRGYHDFIEAAIKSVPGIELVTAAREEKWRGHEQMIDFYHSIDVYICASDNEGTPNPCLEAAASGVPLLTTPVGNMPELVKHGVNGLFIKRDLQDIKEKLILLRDNKPLVNYMSKAIRSSIRTWDWKDQAQHYKAMFESMLAMQDDSKKQLFKSSSQLYLASADRMDNVLKNLSALNHLASRKVDTYATVIGGLSGFNYLLGLEPKNIVFFDINLAALDYVKLIIELISISQSPQDFISKVFSRDLQGFLRKFGQSDLNIQNQEVFLEEAVDKELLEKTLSSLSPKAKLIYQKYIIPHLKCRVLEGVRNCRRLLPCWPVNEKVPVGAGSDLGHDQNKNFVPNTNTFFYGLGWLASERTFSQIKNVLTGASLRFAHADILNQDIRCLCDMSGSVVLHASNIDDWFPGQWSNKLNSWVSNSIESNGMLVVITTNNGVQVPQVNPHVKAFVAVKDYVFGDIVEVTHKVPWGFNEFPRTNVIYNEYLNSDIKADTTILHILLGEGVSKDIFVKTYQKALINSQRIIIIEHNRLSSDWAGKTVSHFVTVEEMSALINEVNIDNSTLTSFGYMGGEVDSKRNMIFVVDKARIKSFASPASQYSKLPQILPPTKDDKAGKISVVLTACNRPDMLKQVLEGFAAQTAPRNEFEVIVVDDGSKPPVKEVVESFSPKLDIRYIYQENSGLAAARNTGIKAMRGEIVLFHDDDDLPHPDLVAEHIKSHRQYPDENISVLGHLDWHPTLKVTPLMHYISGPGGQYFGFLSMEHGKFYDQIKWWGGLISAKVSLLKNLDGPFDPKFRFGYEDVELAQRLTARNIKILYNAHAIKYILRPINFEEFCRRCVRQGRALYHLAQKHPAFTLKRYHLDTAMIEYREHYQINLNKWHQWMAESEPQMISGKIDVADSKVITSLHKIWAACFRGYVVRGYLEEMAAVQEGSTMMGLPVDFQNKLTIPAARQTSHVKPAAKPLRIMFVSNRLPRPDVGSSNVRVHNIVKLLAEAGHSIEYMHFTRDSHDNEYIRQWQNKIKITSLDSNATALINYVYFDDSRRPDILWMTNLWSPAFLERMQETAYWFRRLFPQTRLIIDTMDYHYKKYLRKYEYSKDWQDKALADQFGILEGQLYPVGDRIITVTDEESRGISSAVKGCECSTISNIHQLLTNVPAFDARANIVFIGSMQVNHNLDATRWFVKEVFPLIRQQLPNIEFHILGFGGDSYKEEFEAHTGVKVTGYVPDAEQTISNYRLFVCPMRYGAGMKGKLGTAAAAGTPFVTTTIGAEGFDFADGEECFIADAADEFARKCITLMSNRTLWRQFADRTRAKFITAFSPQAITPRLAELLSSVMDTPPRMFNMKSSADSAPKVAVITAVHNGQAFLAQMIESVLNQTMKEFELWLLDDSSTDNTRQIIEEFGKRDARVKPVFFEDNKGPYVRRNYAIERTAAPFIVIHDADDIMTPTKLEVLCYHMEADDNLGIVGHWYYNFIDEFGGLANTNIATYPLEVRQIKENLLRHEASLIHGAAIIRKKLFGLIGLYDQNQFSSDFVWLQKAALYWHHTGNMAIKNIPDCLMLRRIHMASQVASLPALDPRGHRKIFNLYAAQKVDTLANQLKTFGGSSEALSKLFKQCTCANFLHDCDHLIREAAAKPLDEEVLLCLVYQVMELFNAQNFVGVIKQLYHILSICAEAPRRFRNFDLFKAMAFYALGLADRAWQSIEREILHHNNDDARHFMNDYRYIASTGDVLDWFHKHDSLHNLEIADVQGMTVDETLLATGPLVSVIIAADETTKHIDASIASVLNQIYSRFELLIVDYSSAHNIASVIGSIADSRSRYIRKENGNLSIALNEGIRQARGEYIIFLGPDDAITPHYIYKHVAAFLQHPEASLIYCDYRFIDEQGRHIRLFQHHEYTDDRHLIRDMFRCGYSIIKPRGLIRRNVFDLIGLFDESLLIDEDYDLMRRFVSRGCKAVRLPKALYLQRCPPESLTKTNMLAKATSHFTAVRRWVETFKGEELFPDVDWSKIAPNRRGVYLQTLIGATYRSIGRNYVQSRTEMNAAIAFDLACSALKESLRNEPNNRQARILLDQCENEKRQLGANETAAVFAAN